MISFKELRKLTGDKHDILGSRDDGIWSTNIAPLLKVNIGQNFDQNPRMLLAKKPDYVVVGLARNYFQRFRKFARFLS